MQKQLEPIIEKMSKELDVPYDVCVQAYMSQWHFISEKINSMTIKDMTLEEFQKTKRNFNIPSIGKLCITEKKFQNIQRKFEYLRQKRNKNVQNQEDSSHVQHGDNNDE